LPILKRLGGWFAILRGGLWFLPTLIAVLCGALAAALLRVRSFTGSWHLEEVQWLFGGDAGTARDLLATLLSGTTTMTSLVVSITVVVMNLAAAQLGPRLIWRFIEDRQIQFVLGLFVGTILYLIVVLRSIDELSGPDNIPHLAVTGGSLLAGISVFALLFYVHKMARSSISDAVIRDIAAGLTVAIEEMLPRKNSDRDHESFATSPVQSLTIGASGYIERIDYETLAALASSGGFRLRIACKAGDFVLAESKPIAVLDTAVTAARLADDIRAAFYIGAERNPAQDLGYSIRQIVEIAIRALSPGINDPFTAMGATRHLGAALAVILGRPELDCVIRDRRGVPRLFVARIGTEDLIGTAFDMLQEAAAGQTAVLHEIIDTIASLADVVGDASHREALRRQVLRVEETVADSVTAPRAREGLLKAGAAARARLSGAGALAGAAGDAGASHAEAKAMA
jgi:uncharacterized membrane protein